MDSKNIYSFIKNGESEILEFKSSFQKDVIETVAAFANTKGGIIERYGSGITRIFKECKKYGIKKPKFCEIANGFKVTLFNKKIKKGVSEGVSEGVKLTYDLIEKNSGKRVPVIAELLNTSVKNVERWIKQLKMENKVEYRGSSKHGGYYIIGLNKIIGGKKT